MRRWIPIALLLLVVVMFGLGLIAYFAYGVRPSPPSRLTMSDLSGPVDISWYRDDYAVISTANDSDRYAAVGYAHGVQRAWTVTLWRQAAIGRLGEWFGHDTGEIDRLVRRLGIARAAIRTYSELDDASQQILRAYASGMNAGLRGPGGKADEIVRLGLHPDPWEPWHTLAIERLFVWLASDPPAVDTLRATDDGLQRFARQDSLLRSFLHLGGFAHSMAWTAADSSSIALVQRQVTGASAIPVLYEVAFVDGDSTRLAGATIPGTPFFPAGRTTNAAWSVLPRAEVGLSVVAVGAATVDTLYDRLVFANGDEELVRTAVFGNGIVLAAATAPRPSPEDTTVVPSPDSLAANDTLAVRAAGQMRVGPDSVWVLRWPGFGSETDVAAWHDLSAGSAPAFRLLDGSGLILTRGGDVRVLGNPAVRRSIRGGTFVSNAPLSEFAAMRLDSLAETSEEDEVAFPHLDDCRSTWASQLEPRLVASVDTAYAHPRFMEEALTYLRNWDFSFDSPSIAASVFDRWMSTHIDSVGRLPRPVEIDTSSRARHVLYVTLVATLNELARSHGADMSQWRWEVVAPHVHHFPVWSSDEISRIDDSVLPRTRYAPIEIAGEGHPTTLCWGPSPMTRAPSYPARWEAWISTGDWQAFNVRRRILNSDGFLARYRISDQMPAALQLRPSDRPSRRTRIQPGP